MYKKTDKNTQYDVFGRVSSSILVGESYKAYNDKRDQVTSCIDESNFKVLYHSYMGAPIVSISTLICMMTINEAFCCSDTVMYDNCSFNPRVHYDIGLSNLSNLISEPSVYYILRSQIYNFKKLHEKDLMTFTFETVSSNKLKDFKVNGESILMVNKDFYPIKGLGVTKKYTMLQTMQSVR